MLEATKELTVPVPAALHLSSQPWPGDRPLRFQPHPLHWWPPWHSGAGTGGTLLMSESNTAYSLPTTLHWNFLVSHVKIAHFEVEKLSCSKPHFLNTATLTWLLFLSAMNFSSLQHQLQQHVEIDHICLHYPIFFFHCIQMSTQSTYIWLSLKLFCQSIPTSRDLICKINICLRSKIGLVGLYCTYTSR